MFNGQSIRKLIERAGLTNKQFQEQMFNGKSTDLYHLEKAKNLRSDTLERMRNVLHCSMDEFFTVPSWAVDDKEQSTDSPTDTYLNSFKVEIQYLKDLMSEKDKRIAVLENYVKLLEKRQGKD